MSARASIWTASVPAETGYREITIRIVPGNGSEPFEISRMTRRNLERETALLRAQYPTAKRVEIRETAVRS